MAVLAAAAATLAGALPPLPKKPVIHLRSPKDQAAQIVRLYFPKDPPREFGQMRWLYPPGLNPSNYWWSIWTSVDRTNWVLEQKNVGGETVTTNTWEPFKLHKLIGRSYPW